MFMFNTLLAVFIGGGVGSVARWLVSMKLNNLSPNIPLGTLVVNLIGAFIIGLALALFTRLTDIDPIWKLLITTGFCGGLTTFSTFSVEVVYLIQDGKLAWAAGSILLNLAGSLAMTMLAFLLVNHFAGQ
ncbi:Protein crcB 1 [Yersinia bercovieri ATCC 43970]|nr:Protein crcB 1 [Yersinia bercovieri ATCC 43970]